jgi:sugar lactone lactonase YvrE
VNGSWTAIAGATASAYSPTSADVGDQLRVVVTASNAAGSGTGTSNPVGPVSAAAAIPANTGLPAIAGTPQVGLTLTASQGSWTGSPTGYGFAWQRMMPGGSWTAIAGATARTYTLTSADLGAAVRVEVTASNSSGSSAADSPQAGPVTTSSSGCTAGVDSDGDGVADCDELKGFTLTIATTGTGQTANRTVTSDPQLVDSDGDGLQDGQEWNGYISDPSRSDGDNDGLGDLSELIRYKSVPVNVDSDLDARIPGSNPVTADPRLLDGTEVNGYPFAGVTISTSPTLADTDGDGMSDQEELTSGGFHPLVADLPRLSIGIPDNVGTDFQLFSTLTDTNERVEFSSHLASSTNTTKTVDLTTQRDWSKQEHGFTVDIKGTYQSEKGLGGSVDAKQNNDWQWGSSTTTEKGTTTVAEVQDEWKQYTKLTSEHEVELEPEGTISTAVSLSNVGDTSFRVSDVAVTAFVQSADDPSTIEPVATLTLPADVEAGTLQPNEVRGPYEVSDTHVSKDVILELMRNPGALLYTVLSPQLTDASGSSFAQIGQNVTAQTATVMIDDGAGDTEVHMVATNVERTPSGLAAGVSMKEVMGSILQIPYQTCAMPVGGRTVLCGVRGVASTDLNHVWVIEAPAELDAGTSNFDDIVIRPGDVIKLLYAVDTDGDELLDPQEALVGTDITKPDTDGDGLDDRVEAQENWTVRLAGASPQPTARSSPTNVDIDGDGSWDGCPGGQTTCGGVSPYAPESVRMTDPKEYDTNTDGLSDGQEPDGDVLAFCPGCFRVPSFTASLGSGIGTDPGQFGPAVGPDGVAYSEKGSSLYVTDPDNARVQKWTRSTSGAWQFVKAFGALGSGSGFFTTDLYAVATDASGNVYVTDSQNSVGVQKFDADGNFISAFGRFGPDAGEIEQATGITVDDSGSVWIVDAYDGQVMRYTSTGTLVSAFGSLGTGPGEFRFPAGIAVDVAHDAVYVADQGTGAGDGTVVKFHLDGTYAATFEGLGDGNQFDTPRYVIVDPWGQLYVSDNGTSLATRKVYKLNPSGRLLATIGGGGAIPGLFSLPNGLALDETCNLLVADGGNADPANNARVQQFSYSTGCE